MRTLSAALKAAKNSLQSGYAWVWLAELEKSGWWKLNYDTLTSAFNEESTVTEGGGGSATARILFVVEETSTSGYLIVDTPGGDKVFGNNNPITDAHGGSALVNGTLDMTNDDPIRWYFARNTEDVTYTYEGKIYEALPFELDTVKLTQEDRPELAVVLSNVTRWPESWVRKAGGFLGEEIRLLVCYLGSLSDAPAFDEVYEVKKAGISTDAVQLILGSTEELYAPFPAFRYSRKRCRWIFKGPECGYSGGDTSCLKTLEDCISKSNEDSIGCCPGIPWNFLDA